MDNAGHCIQSEYIRIASILPNWNDIRIADMNELCERLGEKILYNSAH